MYDGELVGAFSLLGRRCRVHTGRAGTLVVAAVDLAAEGALPDVGRRGSRKQWGLLYGAGSGEPVPVEPLAGISNRVGIIGFTD